MFFTEYLFGATGNQVKVYLYLLFLAKNGREAKIADVAKILNIPFKEVEESIKYWVDEKLITPKSNGYIINNIQEIELNKLYSVRATMSAKDIGQSEKNKYRTQAIENINNTYFNGLMSTSWYADIEMWFKKYGFDEQVMITLFGYCYNKSALHRNYIQAVANAWNSNNIKSYNDLELYEEKMDKLKLVCKAISKKLRLTRPLTEFEEDKVKKWSVEFGFGTEILELALKKTTSKANFSFDYIDKILVDWNDRNLKTVADIENYLATQKQQNKNIKELQKKVGYFNYEQREYTDLDAQYANLK
jgi:DnaD/phage-associated family protein